MSLEMMTWAKRQFGLKPTTKMVLLMLADDADMQGVSYLGQAKLAWLCELSERRLRDHLKALEDHDLLHRERRSADFVRGGRKVDAVVLHDDVVLAGPTFPGADAERREAAQNRRRYEVSYHQDAPEQVLTDRGVSPSQDQPDETSGSPVDNHVSPSEDQPDVSSGKADLSGRLGVFEPDDSRQKSSGALKGTRARLTRQSRQSVRAEAQPGTDGPTDPTVDNSRGPAEVAPATDPASASGDGRTDRRTGPSQDSMSSTESTTPASSSTASEVSPVVRGVSVSRLRGQIGEALAGLDDDQVVRMIQIVLDRASGPVRSPLRFVAAAFRAEPEELTSQVSDLPISPAGSAGVPGVPVAEGPELEAAWSEYVQELNTRTGSEAGPELVTCPEHHIQHKAGAVCPSCKADRISEPPRDTGPVPQIDVDQWKEQLRAARRAEKLKTAGSSWGRSIR